MSPINWLIQNQHNQAQIYCQYLGQLPPSYGHIVFFFFFFNPELWALLAHEFMNSCETQFWNKSYCLLNSHPSFTNFDKILTSLFSNKSNTLRKRHISSKTDTDKKKKNLGFLPNLLIEIKQAPNSTSHNGSSIRLRKKLTFSLEFADPVFILPKKGFELPFIFLHFPTNQTSNSSDLQ